MVIRAQSKRAIDALVSGVMFDLSTVEIEAIEPSVSEA
jgi:hypothetical protein